MASRSMKAPNYRIVARANSAELYLYDDIGDGFFGGITSKQVINDLQNLGKVAELTVRINSGGGSVFEGFAIYNALNRNSAKVIVEIDSLAASIASIIAMAGDEINIAENAMMMIHDPMGFSMGTSEDMRKMAESLDSVRGNLIKTYTARTGNKDDIVSKWMGEETWMDAADCVKFGFADSMSQPLQLAASADLSRFKNVPGRLLNGGKPRPAYDLRAARLAKLAEKQVA